MQQTLGTPSTASSALPANLTAAAVKLDNSTTANAAQQSQTLIDAKPGDFFGAAADDKPLVANQTLVGSTANPNALTDKQLQGVATNGLGATPEIIPSDAHPVMSAKAREVLGRMAQARGLSAESLATQLKAATAGQPQGAANTSQSSPTTARALVRPGPQRLQAERTTTSATTLPAPTAQKAMASVATLGAAAPGADPAQSAAATSQGPSGLPSARSTLNTSSTLGGAAPQAAASTSAAPANVASSAAKTPLTDYEKGRADAVKRGDASVGASTVSSEAAFNKKLQEAWAAVDKAGQAQNFSAPINWQSFFNILAARNAKLIGMFIELMKQTQQLENQTTIQSLQLDKTSKEAGISFDRAQAMLQVARAIFNLKDASTANANRVIFNQDPFLNSTELDLRAGLGNQQMRAPIQRVYAHSFVHQLAGDPGYHPLLEDDTHHSSMADFQTAKQAELAAANPEMSKQQLHALASQHYREEQSRGVGPKIAIETTEMINGVETKVPLKRHIPTPSEALSLSPADQARNKEMMKQMLDTTRENIPARVSMFQAEIQGLESAAARSCKPEERAHLLALAEELRPQYLDAEANMRGAADDANAFEKRFDESMRNRGELEVLRRKAEAELNNLQTIVEPIGGDAAPISDARETALAKKAIFQEKVDTLNREVSIIDAHLNRYFDSKADNRRGRHQTGAAGVAAAYRENQQLLASAQATLAAHPDAADRDHQEALKKIQTISMRLGQFNTYPGFFKNPVKLHEELYKRMQAHQRANGTALDDTEHNANVLATFARDVAAGHDGLSLEGVTRTRMLTHLRQRLEELKHEPDPHPEKQALQSMDRFWRESTLWAGGPHADAYAPPLQQGGLSGALKAMHNNIKLRGERNVAQNIPNPKDIPTPSIEQHWLNADGTQGARVNFNDPDETSRFYSARAATNGNILGMQNEIKGGGGAYRNNAGHHMERVENTLQNLSINAGSHLETMQDFASNSYQGLSSDAQESLSDFMNLVAQLQQQANGMLLQMYQLANAKVGR